MAQEQVRVGVREAAAITGVSTKRIRRWVREGAVRGEMVAGKFGPTWAIEVATLPPAPEPLAPDVTGVGEGNQTPGAGALAGVLRMLDERDRRLEGAAVRLGQLEGEREQRLELTARAESLLETVATERARAAGLESRLRLRTWSLAIALAGFLVAAATALLR